MIVYRDCERTVCPGTLLRRCMQIARGIAEGSSGEHAQVVALLIEFGELEAGLADAWFPSADGCSPGADACRRAALAVGDMFRASWLGEGRQVEGAARAAVVLLDALLRLPLPPRVRLRVAEGYAYYGLYPETYLASAQRFVRETRPTEAVCIGIRSIGTSLSAVVGAALRAGGCGVSTLTVRPRGHPFDRRPRLRADLEARLRQRKHAHFLIVDEGPGLSGSSFAGTADALAELGVADDRIVFFPSWPADGSSFVCEKAQHRWQRHRRVHSSFEESWLARGLLSDGRLDDLSAGRWCSRLYARRADYPATDPQHERRKYLGFAADSPVLFKFAGLGAYGEAKRRLAEHLADAGFAPPVLGLRHGFLMHSFVPGRPLGPRDAGTTELSVIAAYLIYRKLSSEERPVRFAELAEMIRLNVAEGLGEQDLDRLGDLERLLPLLQDAPAIAVDARMMPHEWLKTPSGLVKVDGTDHHDDHFFPGYQDLAWDIAGLGAEFRLTRKAVRDLATAVAAGTRDRALPRRLPFYEVAYLAYRLGYATLSAGRLGPCSEQGMRMARLAERCRRRLSRAIARLN